MTKRDHFIATKLTEKEYEYVCKMADADKDTRWRSGRKNLAAYVRKCILQFSGYQKEIQIKKELNELTYQVRKIGVNINQAVKKINVNFYDVETTERLHDGLDQVETMLKTLIQKLEATDGSHKIDEH